MAHALHPGIPFLFAALLLLQPGCTKNKPGKPEAEGPTDYAEMEHASVSGSRAIAYDMTLPVEMAGLFDHVGANFNRKGHVVSYGP